MNARLFAVFSLSLSICLLTACQGKSNDKSEETTSYIAETVSSENESNSNNISQNTTQNSSETVNQEEFSTHDNSFDADYETNILVQNVWKSDSLDLFYRFNNDKIYYINNVDDNSSNDYGTYYFSGTEGNPVLVFESLYKNLTTSYNITFLDEKHAELVSVDGSDSSFLIEVYINPSSKYSDPDYSENISDSSYNISYKQLNEDVYYPYIEGLENEDFQNLINDKFFNDQKEMLDSLEDATYSVTFSEKYCDDDIISLFGNTYINYEGSAHPTNYFIAYNIDLQKGAIMTLSDVVDLKMISDYLFNNQNCTSEIDIQTIIDYNFFESSDDVYNYLKENESAFCFKDKESIEVYFPVSHAAGDFATVNFDL